MGGGAEARSRRGEGKREGVTWAQDRGGQGRERRGRRAGAQGRRRVENREGGGGQRLLGAGVGGCGRGRGWWGAG